MFSNILTNRSGFPGCTKFFHRTNMNFQELSIFFPNRYGYPEDVWKKFTNNLVNPGANFSFFLRTDQISSKTLLSEQMLYEIRVGDCFRRLIQVFICFKSSPG